MPEPNATKNRQLCLFDERRTDGIAGDGCFPDRKSPPGGARQTVKRRWAAFACLDCGVDTGSPRIGEYYMVTDELWLSANPSDAGMLCIGCLEGRLGRKLTPEDFIDCHLNTDHAGWNRKSERLLKRLGAAVTGDTCVNPPARAYAGGTGKPVTICHPSPTALLMES